MTEKGHQYQMDMKMKIWKQMLSKLEKDGKKLLDDLTSEDKEGKTQEDATKAARWRHNYVTLKQTDGDLQHLLGEGYESFRTGYDGRLREIEELRATIESLAPCEPQAAKCTSVKSGSSRSRASSSSSMKAQLYLMKVKEDQAAVELRMRAAALEEKRQLEREKKMIETQMQELSWKEEKHKLDTELKIQQAKTEVIEKMERQIDASLLNPEKTGEETEKTGARHPEGEKQVSSGAHLTDCHDMHTDMTNRAAVQPVVPSQPQSSGAEAAAQPVVPSQPQSSGVSLPQIQPGIYRGDHATFHMWLRGFETYIEARCQSPSERLHYLGHYTAGDARNAIAGFLQMGGDDAYVHAKRRLKDRYGNVFITDNELKKRLQRWPEVRIGDSKALTELSDFLEQCLVISDSMTELKMFDSVSEIDMILSKLPRHLCDSWRRIVDRWIYEPVEGVPPQYPPFSQFVSFMSREARVASGPVVSRPAPSRSREEDRKRMQFQREKPARVLLTSAPVNRGEVSRQPQQTHCPVCNEDHSMEHCADFIKMSLKDRQELVRQRGLCGGCLRRGHRWKDCRRKQRCEKCERLHPTLLHDDSYKLRHSMAATTTATQTATSLHVTSSDEVGARPRCTHSMLVPVQLQHPDHPTKKETVYALLDPQSDTCFVKDAVLQKMGLSGKEVVLEVNTMTGKTVSRSQAIRGLVVEDHTGEVKIELPQTYSKEDIPADRQLIPRRETAAQWSHLMEVAGAIPEYLPDADIGILIGINCPKALKPLEIVTGGDDEPWAIRTGLGWSIVGYMGDSQEEDENSACLYINREAGSRKKIQHFAFKVRAREVHPEQLARMFDLDFQAQEDKGGKLSQDDQLFMKTMKEGMRQRADGRFEAPLPLRDASPNLPDNVGQAQLRLQTLRRKLKKDAGYKELYVAAMEEMLAKGYAEPVPEEELEADDGRVWYVPHHGVVQKKKGKLRVVFDCSAEYRGRCLNRELPQGPDVSNNLVGILTRFRKEAVALTCDIEAMFNRVLVTPPYRNLLRFLWWPNGDIEKEPSLYRMTTHLFGAVSSPACAMHALNLTAELYASKHGEEAAAFVRRDFYVDDGLTSTDKVSSAISLIEKTTRLCEEGGFKLAKFACNEPAVLETIPIFCRSKTLQRVELLKDKSSVCEQALGVNWDLLSDMILFHVDIPDRPLTRRGILSGVSSVYDPLGLISPVTLRGKMIIKELCGRNFTWDDPVPEDLSLEWLHWKTELTDLSTLKLPRRYGADMPPSDSATRHELHHFCDASMAGYGACSYLRTIREDGEVACDLAMSKSRVTPKKSITVPRLELAAAVLATEMSEFLERELDIPRAQHFYWCDSRVVLGYIRNSTRRFHVYVANRVQAISNRTTPDQWRFIPSGENPADVTSRGSSVRELVDNKFWWHGPPFLTNSTDLPPTDTEEVIDQQDPEVKRAATLATTTVSTTEYATLLDRLERFSTWFTAKRAVANCLRYVRKLKEICRRRRDGDNDRTLPQEGQVCLRDLVEAEVMILKNVQEQVFAPEVVALKKSNERRVKQRSDLYRLDPFLSEDGMLRVGGRLKRSGQPFDVVHPVILPKNQHVTRLVVVDCHERTRHSGREATLSEVRHRGYWVVQGRAAVSRCILKCVKCIRQRGTPMTQKMSDLPRERIEAVEPFTFTGVDYFGPFYIREKRSEVKRWAVMFTCLSSRAVHLETANSLSADSFLNAYRRFVGRRGPVRRLYCDQGTNFVGGKSLLEAALKETDHQKIKDELLKEDCDWVEFRMNVPHASHMGGVWERQIRTARAVFSSILATHGHSLDDELLRTLMVETEAIINGQPLSYTSMSDTNTVEPLTAQQLLTLKSKVVCSLPGQFRSEDLYVRHRWRRVQFLANLFWTRWRREILPTLHERRRWQTTKPNLRDGDVVIVVDDAVPRGRWPVGRVVRTYPSEDGLVRKVRVQIRQSEYDRPVHRLILLLKADERSCA